MQWESILPALTHWRCCVHMNTITFLPFLYLEENLETPHNVCQWMCCTRSPVFADIVTADWNSTRKLWWCKVGHLTLARFQLQNQRWRFVASVDSTLKAATDLFWKQLSVTQSHVSLMLTVWFKIHCDGVQTWTCSRAAPESAWSSAIISLFTLWSYYLIPAHSHHL